MLTLDQLKKLYQANGERFVEVVNAKDAVDCLEINASTTTGQGPIASTGWHKLAEHQPVREGLCSTVLVCKSSLLETVQGETA